MAVNWTPKQQEIICNRNRDLLVAAAAGSGKTAVLIEHIRSLLTDPEHPVDVDHLLVLTFTRAAAEEMRERLAPLRIAWNNILMISAGRTSRCFCITRIFPQSIVSVCGW